MIKIKLHPGLIWQRFMWPHKYLFYYLLVLMVAGNANSDGPVNFSTTSSLEMISPCPFAAAANLPEDRISCGYLSVPENRRKGDSDTLRIPFAIIHSTHLNPAPDPLVFLAGGPGAAPTTSPHTFKLFASHAFGTKRDIIVYTQRGGLMTDPPLRCDKFRDARGSIYLKNQTLAERDRDIAQLGRQCLKSLQASGRDLAGYSTRENAYDLKDLREALKLKQWNLMAVSYGTLIAFEAAYVDPQGVRSLILDSVVSPQSDLFMSEANRNFSYGLGRLINTCADDAACDSRFPDLQRSLESVIKTLKHQPLTISLSGSDGSPVSMVVNWHDFLGLIHWMLYNSKTLTLIPLLVNATADGSFELMTSLMDKVFPAPANNLDSAAGTFLAVVCRDQFTRRNPLAKIKESYAGFAITSFMQQVCADTAFNYASSPAPKLLVLETPTLILSGKFDPMTPDIYAQQLMKQIDNSTLIRIDNFGHSTLSGYTACQTKLADSFLQDLKDKSSFACLPSIEPPRFVLSLEQAQEMFSQKTP